MLFNLKILVFGIWVVDLVINFVLIILIKYGEWMFIDFVYIWWIICLEMVYIYNILNSY